MRTAVTKATPPIQMTMLIMWIARAMVKLFIGISLPSGPKYPCNKHFSELALLTGLIDVFYIDLM